MQAYELPRFALLHADLYRLSGPAELAELGFDDLAAGTVMLLEWPDRAGNTLPADRSMSPSRCRRSRARASARCASPVMAGCRARVERIAAIRDFLARAGFGEAERTRIQGDASTRSYERLTREGITYILMNSPRRADGPPVRDGKPYSAIAHLAEDVTPFHRHGAGFARARLFRAGDLRRRPRAGPGGAGRPRQRTGGGRRAAGADRSALRDGGRPAGGAARANRCRRRCRSRPASTTGCRLTTWTRC